MNNFTKNVYLIRDSLERTDASLKTMVNNKLERSFSVYEKNINKNLHYLLYCRSPEKVKKYLDKKYEVLGEDK